VGAEDIEIWFGSTDMEQDVVSEMERYLSADEQVRARKFVFEGDRKRYVICRALLRRILGAFLQRDPARISMKYNRYGKPELSGKPVEFSLSHSDDRAAVAVTSQRRIGIDIERIEPLRPVLELAERFFSPSEAEQISALHGEAQRNAFYNCWTRKEAFTKALGQGLAIPLSSFEVTLLSDVPARLVKAEGADVRDWTLKELKVGEGYAGAIAVEGRGEWHLNTGTWDERGVFDVPEACN